MHSEYEGKKQGNFEIAIKVRFARLIREVVDMTIHELIFVEHNSIQIQ